jgi:hypothetical protein
MHLTADQTRTVVYDRWYLAELSRNEANRKARIAPAAGDREVQQSTRIDKREADPRIALATAIDGGRDSYAALSRMLGRSDSYLRRFVLYGVPAALRPDEHRRLADYFGLDERGLGVRDLWAHRVASS